MTKDQWHFVQNILRSIKKIFVVLSFFATATGFTNCSRGFKAVGIQAGGVNLSSFASPEIVFSKGMSDLIQSADVSIGFDVVLSPGTSLKSATCKLNTLTLQDCTSKTVAYTGLPDGDYSLLITVETTVGSKGQGRKLFRKDSSAPIISVSQTPAAISGATSAAFVFMVTDNLSGVASTECALDAAVFTTCTSPVSLANFTAGNHKFQIRATDKAGNITNPVYSFSWSVDLTAPMLMISQKPSAITNMQTASFIFSSSKVGSSFECSLDNGTYSACISPKNYAVTELPQGLHNFSVRGNDALGILSSPVSFQWTIDLTIPSLPSLMTNVISPSKTNSAIFTFNSSDANGIKNYLCATDVANPTAACVSPFTVTALSEGAHKFYVKAIDNAGNISAISSIDLIVDSVSPVVAFTKTPFSSTTITTDNIAFTVTDAGSGINMQQCSLDGAAYANCASPVALNVAIGAHNFQLQATDKAGNAAMIKYSWTVTAAPIVVTDPLAALAPLDPILVANGKVLYTTNCSGCHGDVSSSIKLNKTAVEITNALKTISAMISLQAKLSASDILAIEAALDNRPRGGTLAMASLDVCNIPIEIGNTALVRLSHNEYDNSLRDIFALNIKPSVQYNFKPDTLLKKFSNVVGANGVSSTLLEAYVDSGFDLMNKNVFSNATSIGKYFPSNCANFDLLSCRNQAFQSLISTAFRRPATAEDLTRYNSLYDLIRNNGSLPDEAIKWTFTAVFSSPNFLYKSITHPSPSSPTTVAPLNQYDLASRLSYFLWASTPDQNLLNAAALGQLTTDAQLEAQVQRMLKDPKATSLVDIFMSQWFELDRIDSAAPSVIKFPEFNVSVREDLKTEAKMFLTEIILNNKSFYDLVQGNYTFLNSNLGQFYGIANVVGNFSRVDLSATQRKNSGLLSLGAILTMTSGSEETNIIKRGRWILDNINCDLPPPRPDGIVQNLIGLTGAEAALVRKTNPVCAGCHAQMDPVGLALENFNPIGKYRSLYDTGKVVDSNGVLPNGTKVTSSQELGQVMAMDQKFRACVANKLITYALNRVPTANDKCSVNKIGLDNIDVNKSTSALILAIVKHDFFKKQSGKE